MVDPEHTHRTHNVPLYTYSMWTLECPHFSDINVIIEKEFEVLELVKVLLGDEEMA